ncbi:MAG: PC4/YdbC family ssDNA-binding protein [Eubacteriales bacterium]|nr:PC4/YdbC family ssDNA-binding protein [Eubacteriales bacterium]
MKKYEIAIHIADLCDENNGWKKELNVVQINEREPVYEIRSWNKDHTRMGDGVTLTPKEMRLLKRICESMEFDRIDGNMEIPIIDG